MAEMDTDLQDHQEPRETRASLDTQVYREKMVFKGLKGSLDAKETAAEGETRVLLAELEVLETRDTLDTRVLEVWPESA